MSLVTTSALPPTTTPPSEGLPAIGTIDQLKGAVSNLTLSSVLFKFVIPIVGLVVLLVILFLIFRWYKNKKLNEPLIIVDPVSASSLKPIDGSKVPLSVNGIEYTYSFWVFVRDWSTNLNSPKCVFYRGSGDVSKFEVASPSVWFYPNENKLMVRVSTAPGAGNYDASSYPTYKTTSDKISIINPTKLSSDMFNSQYVSDINNIPLQKWVNITITLWNTTMDVYVNGKLVRSSILPGVPINDDANLSKLYIGGAGGGSTFNGYFSKFKYMNRAITPDEAMKFYIAGPYSSSYWFKTFNAKLGLNLDLSSLGTAGVDPNLYS